MKKKLLSLLLALCLVMALVPMTAFAEGTSVDSWDGTADTSWYTDHKTDTEYHFTTAEQLAGLAQLVNDKTASVSFEGKTIYLDNDLDLSGTQWTPIGNGGNFGRYFAGTFNGQHHKIMNLNHHYTGDELVRNGLFGVVSDGGTLKNLLVIDADIDSNDGSLIAGILADWVNGGTVENCYTSGKIENNVGNKFVGGLIGQCTWSTQVKGCGSDAKVISTESNEDDVDTVGGLIGQWENSADSSSITDCWFGGSVSCNNIYSAVGGILGANFENFSGNKPGVIIKNCIVATKNITCAEPGNITWITAVVKTHVTDCIWPDTPPDGVTLDEEKYPDNKGNYLAVAKLVVDWDAGTASADPTFDQSSCGTAVSKFTSADVLAGLQTNAGAGVEWVAGIGHPTFVWDDNNIPADYTAVDAAIARAILNSKDFGVPQSRKRVYIVGYLRERCAGEILSFTNANAASLIQLLGGTEGNRVYSDEGVGITLTSNAGGFGGKTGLYDVALPIKVDTKSGFQLAHPGDSIDLCWTSCEKRWTLCRRMKRL